jgi:hypothetical protein
MAYSPMTNNQQTNNDVNLPLLITYQLALDTGGSHWRKVIVANNETAGTDRVIVSIDGTNDLLSLGLGQSVEFSRDELKSPRVYLKGTSGGEAYMISGRA